MEFLFYIALGLLGLCFFLGVGGIFVVAITLFVRELTKDKEKASKRLDLGVKIADVVLTIFSWESVITLAYLAIAFIIYGTLGVIN